MHMLGHVRVAVMPINPRCHHRRRSPYSKNCAARPGQRGAASIKSKFSFFFLPLAVELVEAASNFGALCRVFVLKSSITSAQPHPYDRGVDSWSNSECHFCGGQSFAADSATSSNAFNPGFTALRRASVPGCNHAVLSHSGTESAMVGLPQSS